jgi:hypothetical protein
MLQLQQGFATGEMGFSTVEQQQTLFFHSDYSVGGTGIGNSEEIQKSDQIDIGKVEFERNCFNLPRLIRTW